jgi:phosphoglycerate dehydrogenase-like enzyme
MQGRPAPPDRPGHEETADATRFTRARPGAPVKVLLLGDAGRQAERLSRLLADGTEVVVLPREAMRAGEHDGRIAEDDVVVSLRFSRPAGRMPRFALLQVPGAGLDGVELDALPPSTAVCNVFEHETPIAEYVMWALLRHVLQPERMAFSAGSWSDAYRARVPHGELAGRTVGLFGFGRIGRAIAVRARAFGMRVATLDRSIGDAAGLVDLRVPADDLPALLRESDYLVLCAPLTDATRGRFGDAELRTMKRDAVLVNVSRAELVQEAALYRALADGSIGGAVLDVWYAYPAGTEDRVEPSTLPLPGLPNVVATAHSSAWTHALPERRYRLIADNVRRLREGRPLLNLVRAPRTDFTGARA